jgi:hypothetical protein
MIAGEQVKSARSVDLWKSWRLTLASWKSRLAMSSVDAEPSTG